MTEARIECAEEFIVDCFLILKNSSMYNLYTISACILSIQFGESCQMYTLMI